MITKFYGGDYCKTVYNIFIVPFIVFLILINIIILYSIDFRRKKYKITNYVLLALVFVFSVHVLFNNLNSEKKLGRRFLVDGSIPGRLTIYLYKNKTYEIIASSPHVTCHYFGKYNLDKNYLIFDEEIIEKTTHQISKKYRFNTNKKEFESVEIGFPNLINDNL
ncbi:hypothetical protein MQX03_02385 [Chryseobacterium aahli]|uniref:hypothetical protein n=1 Tax=Chryseobacterium aahli TaxID=1278643 RepID=UPI001F61BF1E|nr:hypothetical protein [Chryseobacterium aahli]MCI3936028.1 hypothetical protein [Chryseobacterium aahli]